MFVQQLVQSECFFFILYVQQLVRSECLCSRYVCVQGLLKLDHCFVKPKYEDAEVIEVQAGEKRMKIVMAPGRQQPFIKGVNLAYFGGYSLKRGARGLFTQSFEHI